MTPSELKYNLSKTEHESHFFDRKTMKFFGDTMKGFGCESDSIVVNGVAVDVWHLYRKGSYRKGDWYFRKDDFSQVWSN